MHGYVWAKPWAVGDTSVTVTATGGGGGVKRVSIAVLVINQGASIGQFSNPPDKDQSTSPVAAGTLNPYPVTPPTMNSSSLGLWVIMSDDDSVTDVAPNTLANIKPTAYTYLTSQPGQNQYPWIYIAYREYPAGGSTGSLANAGGLAFGGGGGSHAFMTYHLEVL